MNPSFQFIDIPFLRATGEGGTNIFQVTFEKWCIFNTPENNAYRLRPEPGRAFDLCDQREIRSYRMGNILVKLQARDRRLAYDRASLTGCRT